MVELRLSLGISTGQTLKGLDYHGSQSPVSARPTSVANFYLFTGQYACYTTSENM